jgi:phosphatidylserine/phosphatidylglycerophosphate/cardiolipin synthase-like enzyme
MNKKLQFSLPIRIKRIIFGIAFVGMSIFTYFREYQVKNEEKVSFTSSHSLYPPKACFSPQEACDLPIIEIIQSAKKYIDLAVFDLNRDQIVHALLVAATKKVKVRILVDKRQAKGSHSLVPLLLKRKVSIKFGVQRGYMHHKFMIVDGQMLETGSYNYTNHASIANAENQLYLSDPQMIARYQAQFNQLWEKGAIPQKIE